MATKVFMEALSPTMEEGRLVKWVKNEGDAVKNGETLAEVETDKAIMELVARGDGVLRKRLVNEGESKPVGQLVGVIAGKDENIDAILAEAGGAGAGGGAASAHNAAEDGLRGRAAHANPKDHRAPAGGIHRSHPDVLSHRGVRPLTCGRDAQGNAGAGRGIQGLDQRHSSQSRRDRARAASRGERALARRQDPPTLSRASRHGGGDE